MSDDPKRPDHQTGTRPDTKIIHGGRRAEWLQGMVNVPVHRGSTILFDSVAELEAAAPAFGTLLRPPRNADPMGAGRGADRARAGSRGDDALSVGAGGDHRGPAVGAFGRRRAAGHRQRLSARPAFSATSCSSASGSRPAIMIRWSAPESRDADRRQDARDLPRKPGLADHGGPGRAGHLRASLASAASSL